jgi:hypothetical protein
MTIPPRGPMQNNTDVKNIDNYAPRGLPFPGTGKYPPAATIGAPFSSSSAADRVFPVFMTLASLPAGMPHGVRHLDGGVDRRPPQDQRRGTRGGTIRMPLVSST